jgi:ABC-type antimicrobial peptide transport system permease subunit
VVISLALVMLALPQFNQLTGKQISIPFSDSMFWLGIAGLLLATGFISGSYPALYLSSFKPVRVLKGLPKFSSKALWFRKGLVVFQFTLSMILIIGAIVVNKQVNHIQTINLGYDRENLLYVPLEGDLLTKYELFRNQVLEMPGIQNVTRTSSEPTLIVNGTTGVQWEGKDPNDNTDFAHAAVSYDFVRTMRLQLARGRDFSKDFATDSVGYLINESALKIINLKNPIGKPLTQWEKKGMIIGVLKDFHLRSMHTPIEPLVLRLGQNDEELSAALVRTESGKTKEALASLKKVCKSLNPKFPFAYKFADEEYTKLYKSEQVISRLANCFAFLGIFISCLGLLGLIIFTVEQRTKEIGIRKVLGASPIALFNLLSKEFLFLVSVAMVIASPLAWIAMSKWLQGYAYRIAFSWWMFVIAGVVTIFIAFVTVSFQAVRAAIANPVKSLRME